MITYDRITYRIEGSRSSRTVIGQNVTERPFAGGRVLSFLEVDREGEAVARKNAKGKLVDETRHLIDVTLVVKRVPLRMNLMYGTLEPTTEEARQPVKEPR